jgi:hypothetical protein
MKMLRYERLKNKHALVKCLTGLTVEAFKRLLPAFRRAYEEDLKKRDRQRQEPRQRRWGGGQKGALGTIEDKMVFILFYFRMYPVQMAQGFFFGMGQPQGQ